MKHHTELKFPSLKLPYANLNSLCKCHFCLRYNQAIYTIFFGAIFLTLALACAGCREAQDGRSGEGVQIVKLHQFSFSGVHEARGLTPEYSYKKDVYLVQNWKDTTENGLIALLDQFVRDSFDRQMDQIVFYSMHFVRESSISNFETFVKRPKLFQHRSEVEDMLAIYEWERGHFMRKSYDFDGKIEPNKVEKSY